MPTQNLGVVKGNSIEYNWNGTQLGIRQEGQTEYNYTDLKGADGAGTAGTAIGTSQVTMVAHRGFSLFVPENTLLAFENAKEYGYRYIETDVRETSDGYFVMSHEDDLSINTDGTGNISTSTLATVQACTINNGNGYAEYSNLQIPTLDECLLTCKKLGLKIFLEMKVSMNYTNLIQKIKDYDMLDNVIILCFTRSFLQGLREVNTDVKIAQLFNSATDTTAIDNCIALGNAFPIIEYTVLTTANITYAKQKNVKIATYTVDVDTHIQDFVDYGIDYILTNKLMSNNDFSSFNNNILNISENYMQGMTIAYTQQASLEACLGTLSNGGYYEENGTLTLNSPSTKTGMLYYNIAGKKGDVIELECWVRSISGVAPDIAIMYQNSALSNSTANGAVYQADSKDGDNVWKKLKLCVPIAYDSTLLCGIGIATSAVGIYQIKNVKMVNHRIKSRFTSNEVLTYSGTLNSSSGQVTFTKADKTFNVTKFLCENSTTGQKQIVECARDTSQFTICDVGDDYMAIEKFVLTRNDANTPKLTVTQTRIKSSTSGTIATDTPQYAITKIWGCNMQDACYYS